MYRVYARPGSGSVVVEAVLAEAGADFEVEQVIRLPDRKPPASLVKLNPLGQVPTLILPTGEIMTESAAIAIYLADLYPAAGLAPAPTSPLRPAYLKWLLYMATTIYLSDIRMLYCERYTSDPNGADGVKQAAIAQMAREWDILALALGNRPYLVGDSLSVADIYAAMLAGWNPDVPAFFAKHPNVRALYDRVCARPKIAAIFKRNNLAF
jgi:glutathione S-transferase/GST-like protein